MLKKSLNYNILGFTITELLIALAINAVLFIALTSIFLANLDHYHRALNYARLNEDMQIAMTMMSQDIRRAGYWANARNDVGLDQNTNPFMTSTTDVSVNVANNCILFSYDASKDGTIASISSSVDDERYGYRLSGNVLQARPPGAVYSCTATDWENITDSNVIEITALTFTLTTNTLNTGPSTRGVALRDVDISMTGRLTSNHSFTKTITNHVRIRNDKFIP